MRIALYGGTFDPVHAGHMEVARRLLSVFALNEVLFIPAHMAPHKRQASVTPALHRYAMLTLATQGETALRVSTVELDVPEKPYTVETLSRLRVQLGESAKLFFVMGADSWAEITTWYEWERLLELSNHIVVTRPGYELNMSHVTPAVRARVVDMRGGAGPNVGEPADNDGAKIFVTDAVSIDISSTGIRRAASAGHDREWQALVPPAVADYIEKYGLYKEDYGTEFDG